MDRRRKTSGLVKNPRSPVRGSGVLLNGFTAVSEDDDGKHEDHRRVDESEQDTGDLRSGSCALVGDDVGKVVLVRGVEVVVSCSGSQEVLVAGTGLAVGLDGRRAGFENECAQFLLAVVSKAVDLDLVVSCGHVMTPSSLLVAVEGKDTRLV